MRSASNLGKRLSPRRSTGGTALIPLLAGSSWARPHLRPGTSSPAIHPMASEARFFANELSPSPLDDAGRRSVLKAAAAALKEVKACAIAHTDVSGGSVYTGLAGVALLYLTLAQKAQRGVSYAHGAYLRKHDVSRCLRIADELLQEADRCMSTKRVTFLEGCSGVAALRALTAHMQGDGAAAAAHVAAATSLWQRCIQGVLVDSECELLYGRAGYLYSLAWLQRHMGHDAVPAALMKDAVSHILRQGLRGAQQLPAGQQGGWPLMYAWHDKAYLGAAHGLAGILYVLLCCWPLVQELDADEAAAAAAGAPGGSSSGGRYYYCDAVRRSVDALAIAAFPSGNLPTKSGDTSDVRVAWCHGGAGLVLTMLKAVQVLGDPGGRYRAAAEAAGNDIWRRGLLTKGVGLCHGISGNGYALLALARSSGGDLRWLGAAQAFALFGATNWPRLYDTPDRPASLYEGLAGAVCFWMDAVADPEHSIWPGAEL